jgi:endo-1,4-beta-D-glucanase Y
VRALALLSTLVAAVAVAGCAESSGQAAPGPQSRAATAAELFLRRYAGSDGRVRRIDQGGDTVSEGQAYGMLAAAGLRDWRRFDAIWAWTRQHLGRPDGLLSWRWAGGRVTGQEAASDADLDAARALLVAGCVRRRTDLRRAGIALGTAVLRHETARRGNRTILAAGPWATGEPVTVNPSYLDPVTLDALAAAGHNHGFAQLAADGRALIAQVARPLPPDWATVNGAGAVQASGPPGQVVPARYGFDAPRTLIRLAEDPSRAGRRQAAAAWPVFRDQAPDQIVVERALDGSPAGGSRSPVALVAAAAAAKAAGDRGATGRLLSAADALDARTPTYYGAAWAALGRLLLTTNRLQPCGR